GYAYRHKKEIFFDPLKFPGFGRLYGLDLSKWPKKRRRFRKDTYPGRRWNLGDFILWHGHRPHQDGSTFWDSPLGPGRPAWNIQDPAMISKHMGFQVDICCGGVDNLYRHHDYNIAVIEAASGYEFCHYWLHGEHVLLDGKKISKSEGNIIYPGQLLEEGISSGGLRWYLIDSHYRKRLNLTDKTIKKTENRCRHLKDMAHRFSSPIPEGCKKSSEGEKYINALVEEFEKALNNDLQVNTALKSIEHNLGKLKGLLDKKNLNNSQRRRIEQNLIKIDSVLQVIYQ
ncbi:MAG: class I tRNA ligase family protein, partial [Desulfobia sp.]